MNLANCAAFILPATDFDDCNPEVNYSEIERIYIAGPTAAAFANIQNQNEWNQRLSQSTLTADSIRSLTVIGDMPASAAVVKELSNGRRKSIGKDYTVNYTVDDLSDATYNFFKQLDEQPLIKLFGFDTQGGKRYHYGNNGQIVNHVSNLVLARGRDEVEVENGTITWREKNRPQRFTVAGTTAPTTFDSTLTFASGTSDSEDGVAGTASASNANLKFEFNQITPQVGTPASMTIKVGTVTQLVVDYTSDYNGSSFKFTDTAGAVHTGNFTNGTVTF